MPVSCRGVLVASLTMNEGLSCMLFGGVVLTRFVKVSCLVVVVSGGMVVSGGLMVMLARRMPR